MLRSALVTLMIAGFATVAVAETVYKWVDAGGQVHYTDRPPTETGAKLLGVFEREFIAEENGGEGADEVPQFADAGAGAPDEPEAANSTVASVQQDVERVRSEQCKQAQERYKTYIESRRLYRQTTDGQREYLSDAELSKARIEAKQAVDELCN